MQLKKLGANGIFLLIPGIFHLLIKTLFFKFMSQKVKKDSDSPHAQFSYDWTEIFRKITPYLNILAVLRINIANDFSNKWEHNVSGTPCKRQHFLYFLLHLHGLVVNRLNNFIYLSISEVKLTLIAPIGPDSKALVWRWRIKRNRPLNLSNLYCVKMSS